MATASTVEDPGLARDLSAYVQEIEALEQIVATWSSEQQATVSALKLATDALHREALVRLVREVRSIDSGVESLKQALKDELVYAVMRHLEIVKPSLQERIEQALQSVRPQLASHGGDVELVAVTPPNQVSIRLLGACDGCPASGLTLSEGVEKAIKAWCPEITAINTVNGSAAAMASGQLLSPFAASQDGAWSSAARVDEIPNNDVKFTNIKGESVLLTRNGDQVKCFQNACAHLGMPLDSAEVRDGVLVCPHHRFEYLLASGECLSVKEVQLHAHEVRVIDGQVEVKLK